MGKKKPEDHIPWPSNKFILFRIDKIAEFKDRDRQARRPVLTQPLYSKEAAVLWNSLGETSDIKLYYTERAKEALAEHRLKYPDYKPQMKKRKRKLPSLPDSAPSSLSSSAQTTPGSGTPSTPAGLPYLVQASVQGNLYGPPEMEQPQHTIPRYAHQQMLAQDRAFAHQHTTGFVMGPAPRQCSARAEAACGELYALAAAHRGHALQQPQRLQGYTQSMGNGYAALQPPAEESLGSNYQFYAAPEPTAYGPPAQAIQQRMTMQQSSQAPQPLRMSTEFALPDTGFYHSAVLSQENATFTYLRRPPVQPPPGHFNGHGYNFLPDVAFLPTQAVQEPSSFWMPAYSQAPVTSRIEQQWDIAAPASTYGYVEQQFNGFDDGFHTNDSCGPELYGAHVASTSTYPSYVPMKPFVSDATGATMDTACDSEDWGFFESSPSDASSSVPNGDIQQPPYVPTNAYYTPAVGDQRAPDEWYNSPPSATHQPSVVDAPPSSMMYASLENMFQDAFYHESLSSDKSMDALFDWAVQKTMDG
ncbi:hypothetical protein TRAPUB_3113 [Trametes pubescens]|uniref:HMG box domain-containing protein n=1 Tax=Trametes pubescens TaxID=154538 RepID=A0A1M2VES8_TRAPU|nr:hypothetical protein TRAPUB_3113 [Trametes pubescens]